MKKQIFDGAGIFACFKYFSDHPGPCFTRVSKIRGAKDDLATSFIGALSATNISICNISVEMISVQSAFT